MKENIIKDKSCQFALKVIRFYKFLESKREFIIGKQILRSGTAIGVMAEEANQAESKADFIHKLSIVNKEANETHYWFRFLYDSSIVGKEHVSLLNDCQELIRLLTAIIQSTKANLKK